MVRGRILLTMTTAFLLLAGMVAVSDWFAVGLGDRTLDRIARPSATLALVLTAVVGTLGVSTSLVVAGLVFGLIGDVVLQRVEEGRSSAQVEKPVLAYSAMAICYLLAFLWRGVHPWLIAVGVLVVAGVVAAAVRILRHSSQRDKVVMNRLLAGFGLAIAAVVVAAFGTGSALTAVGAIVLGFAFSVLCWTQTVQRLLRGQAIFVVTFQAAQILIVSGMVR